MSETITFHALDLSGETGLKLYLRKSDGSLLNTDGDTFTEPATGMFQTTLTESRAGLGSLAVRVCDGTETADNLLYDGFLPEGSTTIGQAVQLDAATLAILNDIPTTAEFQARTLVSASYATASALSDIQTDVDANTGYLTSLTTNMTTLLGRVTANVYSMWLDLIAMISGSGVNPKYTTTALSNAPTGSGGSGSLTQEDLDAIIAGVQAVHLNITEAVENCGLTITKGDTWIQDITGLGDLSTKRMTFAIKSDRRDADSAAIVFIDEADGLTYLNGAVASDSTMGAIEIIDESAGDIRIRLESSATKLIPTGKYVDAVKTIKDNADFTLRNNGTTTVVYGVIQEIS